MNIKLIMFDLDGTLLPMDQDVFTGAYFKELAAKFTGYGYDPEKLIDSVWKGTAAMVQNNGKQSNEDVFWNKFIELYGEEVRADIPLFENYYENEFDNAQKACGYNEEASKTINILKDKGYRVALATNPIFPAIATKKRIKWAGCKPEDFEIYTTYENSSYCKPNPDYYRQIFEKLGYKPEECMMVGNDAEEDMAAQALGIKVFLLTDCLINKKNRDISQYPGGSFKELMEYIDKVG